MQTLLFASILACTPTDTSASVPPAPAEPVVAPEASEPAVSKVFEVVDGQGKVLGKLTFAPNGSVTSEGVDDLAEAIRTADLRFHDGSPVPRDGSRFVQMATHRVITPAGRLLRVPRPNHEVQSFQVYTAEGGTLGEVEVDSAGYVRMRDGDLPPVLDKLNRQHAGGIDIAPPAGKRGTYARIIDRVTPAFVGYLRHEAAEAGLVLATSALPDGARVHHAELPTNGGWGAYLAAPGQLSPSTAGKAALSLSGPPGGPLGVAVWPDVSSVEELAKAQYGSMEGFAVGPTLTVELVDGPHSAHSFRVGTSMAASDHVFVLFTDPKRTVALELWVGAMTAKPLPAAVLEHEALAPVLASFVVGPHR